MSVRLTATIGASEIGKSGDAGRIVIEFGSDGEGSDETRIMILTTDPETNGINQLILTADKDDLLEAVARVSGSDIRLAEKGD